MRSLKSRPLTAALLLVVAAVVVVQPVDGAAAEPAAFDTWATDARIGGASTWVGMEPEEIDAAIAEMVAQNVSVIEADSDLSNYGTEAEFAAELALITDFSAAAHAAGLKVVWYYPALEVTTPNGKNIPETMYKDHPEWIQIGLDGTPNVFYGGSGQVFWVEQDMESAWMSPSSGYRDYFIDRVEQIVATGVDGLWADVPIYADFGPTLWTDLNPAAVTEFESTTGYVVPADPDSDWPDWDDPNWRHWIEWRHQELARFLTDVAAAAQAIDPDFPIIAETLPTDYNGGTIYGLDAGYLKDVPGVSHVFEVDTMSNNVGMRNALEDDWISFISAFKYASAATGDKPAWAFNYGVQEDDAELVMAESVASGVNPYELEVPEMTTTVGDGSYRTRMFNWIDANSEYLWERDTGAKVGLYYSSASRDYVDQFGGLGMFVTWDSNDDLWWAGEAVDSAYERQFLAEYRGILKLLVHEHVPFDAVVFPSAAELARYETVILPDVEAISDADAALLDAYVAAGGNLIVTGPDPSGFNEYGDPRTEYALAPLLGFSKTDPLPTAATNTYGAGEVQFHADLVGKDYFVTSDAGAATTLMGAIDSSIDNPLATDADRRVHVELSQSNTDLVLQMVNFIGVDGSFSVVPTSFTVTLDVPAGKAVTSVALTTPDTPGTAIEAIAHTKTATAVSFDVPLEQYAMVVIGLGTVDPDDHTPPVISLLGDDPQVVEAGTAYVEHGATASDDTDGDISGAVQIDASSVDSATLGSYPVTYNVSDLAGNPAVEVVRTVNVVDTTPPVITINGANPQILDGGSAYIELGATAADNHDVIVPGDIVVDASEVNPDVAGDYMVTYNVSDVSGNAAEQETRTVRVVDAVPPEIALLGDNPQIITVGDPYVEAGATAADNVDGDVTDGITIDTSAVNTGIPGVYGVTYNVSDAAGNDATEVVRTVNVVDAVNPVIGITGDDPYAVFIDQPYVDPGATAYDAVDGDLTSAIVVDASSVDTGAVGTYLVTYNVSDSAGNAAPEATRTVIVVDNVNPVITLLGDDPQIVSIDAPYVEAGATATDNVDGDLTGEIVVDASGVDTGIAGMYRVTYNVSDSAGNAAPELARTVNVVSSPVVDNVAPVIVLLGSNPQVVGMGSPYVELGATATDKVSGDLTSRVAVDSSAVNASVPGTYTVTYRISDEAGNVGTASRTVNIVDFFTDDDASIFQRDINAIAAAGVTKGCNPPTNDRYCVEANVTRGQFAAFIVRAFGLMTEADDPFVDDDQSIFESDIERLYAAGITKGCNPSEGNTRFCPSRTLTRGEAAAMFVRAFGYSDSGGGDLFIDDDGSVFEDDIDRLATAGVTRGCNPQDGNTKFCPESQITRGQIAAFIARALGL